MSTRERTLDKMRKDFVSSVSHELKTPLSLILGYAEGLQENVAERMKTAKTTIAPSSLMKLRKWIN